MFQFITKHKLMCGILLTPFAAIGLYLVYNMEPGSTIQHFMPKCMFHELTGLHCPGCGGTRAVHALLHGQFLLFMHDNLFLVPATVSVVVAHTCPRIQQSRLFQYSMLTALILFWILRNIPYSPFTLLAPVPLS